MQRLSLANLVLEIPAVDKKQQGCALVGLMNMQEAKEPVRFGIWATGKRSVDLVTDVLVNFNEECTASTPNALTG